jgi:hypothetical protein
MLHRMANAPGSRTARFLCGALLLASIFSCTTRRQSTPVQPYPAPYPYGAYAGAPQQPPGTVPVGPGQPPPAGPLPAVAYDPINANDLNFLRSRAQNALNELVANLPALQQARVRGIPLVIDDEVGEVNAFAACTAEGKSLMAISDGMLDISGHLAQARAIDELFGLRKVDEYVAFIARNQRPKTPIVQPPLGFFDLAQTADGRKVQRQHQILDEQLAFVLGHELAHHYLGHLPCTAGNVTASEIGRVLSDVVPAFNQPAEIAADMAGVNNVLTTGARRQGYRFNEGGALLTMQFFSGVDQLSPIDIVFGFERSHPPPAIRIPVIQQTANTFRATGGQGLPIFGL